MSLGTPKVNPGAPAAAPASAGADALVLGSQDNQDLLLGGRGVLGLGRLKLRAPAAGAVSGDTAVMDATAAAPPAASSPTTSPQTKGLYGGGSALRIGNIL